MKYYSELLNKTFDTVEQLENEEASKLEADKKVQEEKEKLQVARKDLAHQVEEAYKHYIEVLDANDKKLEELHKKVATENKEAETKFKKLRNEFIDKYGSFHMTFKDNVPVVDTAEPVEKVSFTDVFNDMFDLFKLLR